MNKLANYSHIKGDILSIPDPPCISQVLTPQVCRVIEEHLLTEYPEVVFKSIAASNSGREINLFLVSSVLSHSQVTTLAQQVSLLSGMQSEVFCLKADETTLQSQHLLQLIPLLSRHSDIHSVAIQKGILRITFAGANSPEVISTFQDELGRLGINLKVEGLASLEQCHSARALPSYKIVNSFGQKDNCIAILPPQDIALLFNNSLLYSSSSIHKESLRNTICRILQEELPTTKYDLAHYGTNVLITFDKRSLVSESAAIYNTLHRIRASIPVAFPLIVTQVPYLASSTSSISERAKPIYDGDISLPSEALATGVSVACARPGYSTLYQTALSRVGTREPWYFIEDDKNKTLQIFTNQECAERLQHLEQEFAAIAQERGYSLSLHPLTLHPLESLHISPMRDSISIREWRDLVQFAHQVCVNNIKDSPIKSVYSIGNILVIETDFTLPEACQSGIRHMLQMVPAPILFKAKNSLAPKLNPGEIKSIVKLGLPSASVLQNFPMNFGGVKHTSGKMEEISFSILGHFKDKAHIHGMCAQLQHSLPDQKLLYTVESYTKEVSGKIRTFVSPLYRYLLTGVNSYGDVNLRVQKRSTSKKNTTSHMTRREEEGWIRTLANSHRDATHLFCWTVDPIGASLKEDALSIRVTDDNAFTLTVHLSNVALGCPPFSTERHKAYKLGESLYDSSRNVLPMLPHSHLFSLNVGEVRPVISVSWSFQRSKDGVWDLATPHPNITNELISVKAALSSDMHGRTVVVQGRLPSKPEQFCAQIAAKVLMTGKLIQSSDSFAQWAVNQQQQHFLGHANLALGNYLRGSGLPLIYQKLSRPSFEEFNSFCSRLSLKEFRRISPLSLDEIYANDDFLRRFIMRVKDHYRFNRRGRKTPFSMLGQPSLLPEYHFIYGEEGVALFNAPARRALSLVNTHQFSAFLGLVEPMSRSEVNEAFSLHQKSPRLSIKEDSTITLARHLEQLRKRENSRLRAVVTELKPGKIGIDAVVLIQNPKLALSGVIQNIGNDPGISNLGTLVKGSKVYVTPSTYSHLENQFYFSISPDNQ